MKIGVVAGPRYYRVDDKYYTTTSYHADMWKECLEIFEEVVLFDRVIRTEKAEPGFKLVSIEGVSVIDCPDSHGFFSILCKLPKMFIVARRAARQADLWHLHPPSICSVLLWFWLWVYRIPYSLEMRGDQSMNISYLKLRGTYLPGFVAFVLRLNLWLQLSRPLAVLGVAKYLVDKYKPRNGCPSIVMSDNRVPSYVYKPPRTWAASQSLFTIVSTGNIQAQKNPAGLLRACAYLDKRFPNWRLVWIGKGPLLEPMKQFAKNLGISEKVDFCGFVPWGPQLFDKLCNSDLFVLNSVSEGMPRAMLEAMACGLPAIGTDVGGIPELLAPEDVVSTDRDDLLADRLYEVLTDSDRLTEMSRRNIKTAENYSAEILTARKMVFYRQLRQEVEKLKK